MSSILASNPQLSSPAKSWNIVLWIASVALAGLFLMSGFMKLATPIAELNAMMPWSADLPDWLVRFIGFSQLLGAVGVLLPSITRIRPGLTVLAAGALGFVMVLAGLFHLVRGEDQAIGMNVLLGALAFFVAWGRGVKAPIRERS